MSRQRKLPSGGAVFDAPVYWFFARLPASRDTAHRLGLVTLKQILHALIGAIENPSQGIRIHGVEAIRRASLV